MNRYAKTQGANHAKPKQFSGCPTYIMAVVMVMAVMGVSVRAAWVVSDVISIKCNIAMAVTVSIAILVEFLVIPLF